MQNNVLKADAPGGRFHDCMGGWPGYFYEKAERYGVYGLMEEGEKMLDCIVVGIGGFAGSVCRYLIGLIPVTGKSGFPVKTFLINIIGSFLIGLIAAAAAKNGSLNPRIILFLKVGICGGFTTFSSFALETGDLVKNGDVGIAVLYAVLSMVLGVAAVFGGEAVAGGM